MMKENISKYCTQSIRKEKQDGFVSLFHNAWKNIYDNGLLYKISVAVFDKIINSKCMDRNALRKQCTENEGASCILIDKKEYDTVRKSRPMDSGIGTARSITVDSRHIYIFDDASIVGPLGIGISNEGLVIAETVASPELTRSHVSRSIAHSMSENGILWTYNRFIHGSNNDTMSEIRGFDEACLLIPLFNNYYHWTIECLLKIRGIEQYSEKTGNTPTLLIPENMTSWMFEALSLAGIDPDEDCVQWNERESHISRLVVPSYPEPTPAECRWLKNRTYNSVGIDSNETAEKRIYISREDATRRRVRNEDELMATLSEYGVERKVLSNLSVAEQVELFSKSDIVISPHGAGLTNIVYASDEVSVIELFGERKKNTFYRIAEMLDFDYRYIDCDHDSIDIIADIDRIEREVQNAIND